MSGFHSICFPNVVYAFKSSWAFLNQGPGAEGAILQRLEDTQEVDPVQLHRQDRRGQGARSQGGVGGRARKVRQPREVEQDFGGQGARADRAAGGRGRDRRPEGGGVPAGQSIEMCLNREFGTC